MNFVCLILLLTLFSCSKQPQMTAIVSSDQLIASQSGIPIVNSNHPLTRDDYDRLNRHYPKTLERIQAQERLNVQDIKNMTRAGLSDDAIAYEITHTRSKFYLTPDDERDLEQAGVSRAVIGVMKDTVDDRY